MSDLQEPEDSNPVEAVALYTAACRLLGYVSETSGERYEAVVEVNGPTSAWRF
jgi:hypothetical protein